MEPNNIEKLIQDNFKDRSIEPSAQARERLIVALNTKPKKKKKLQYQNQKNLKTEVY